MDSEKFREAQDSTSRHLIALGLLFLTALGIRLAHISEPPLNFHAVRQYRTLLIARAYFYETSSAIPDWKKQIVRTSMERQPMWEPQIMEIAASLIYRITRTERFWIPRIMSSAFWLIGAVFLYLIATELFDADAAVFSTAFYLLLPFAVLASRSAQPDSLMVMGLIVSVFTIFRYYQKPSAVRLFVAAIVSAMAILTKFVGLFALWGSFASIGLYTMGFRRFFRSGVAWSFVLITATPALLFYSYGIFIRKSLSGVAEGNILPHLVLYPFFWEGWLTQIGAVVGYPALVGALFGILLVPGGLPRALLSGLWAGYIVFGLVFTYTIHTHDYWNLQLVPIVALCLGPVASALTEQLRSVHREWHWRWAMTGIALLAVVLVVGTTRNRLADLESERKVQRAHEIGEQVNNRTDIIYLSGDYGLPLEYHGELSGTPWPLVSDIEWEQLAGVPVLGAEERFNSRFAKHLAKYFIVEDLREFEQQPDLKRFLSRFPLVVRKQDYLIFKLR